MPPVNVAPLMMTAADEPAPALIALALSITRPWAVARMLPLSKITPVMVLCAIEMPVAAAMVPALDTLPPVKIGTLVMAMPALAAVIAPLLVTPPSKLDTPELRLFRVVTPTAMPLAPAEIVPLLAMPPPNLVTPLARMPDAAAEIVPPLLMPPRKVTSATAAMPTEGTCAADLATINPVLPMPPVNVVVRTTPIPVPTIVPLLVMPFWNVRTPSTSTAARLDAMLPVLTMPPVMLPTLLTRMPLAAAEIERS